MISQSVSVVAGQRYAVDFWYAAEATNFYNSNTVTARVPLLYDVVIDGVVVQNNVAVEANTFRDNNNNVVNRTQSNMGWKFAHYEWVASTTGTVDLGFAMQNGFAQGVALDNVSFHAMVPEPGTFALAGLGLLPLGYMIRRRRNTDAE